MPLEVNKYSTPAVTQQYNSGVTAPEVNSPRIQQLLDYNPYRQYSYKESFWQSMMSALGFRTNADKMREQMALQAQEYDASVIQKMQDEAYESPSAEVARLRAAGLNPDLQGIGDVQGAQPLAQDNNPALVPEGSDIDSMSGLLNVFMGIGTTATALLKDSAAIKSMRIANETNQYEQVNSLFDTALNAVLNYTPSNFDKSIIGRSHIPNMIRQNMLGTMPKNQFRKFMNIVDSIYDKLPSDEAAYKQWRSIAESQVAGARARGTYGYDEDNLDILTNYFQVISKAIYDADFEQNTYRGDHYSRENVVESQELHPRVLQAQNASKFEESIDSALQAELENVQNANALEYEQGRNPSLEASTERSGLSLQGQRYRTARAIESVENKVAERLQYLSVHGNKSQQLWASIALAMVSALKSGNLPISFNRRVDKSTSNRYDYSQKSENFTNKIQNF